MVTGISVLLLIQSLLVSTRVFPCVSREFLMASVKMLENYKSVIF